MSAAARIPQTFWSSPIRYLRWASHEKPAIFWSCIIGACGPLCFAVIPPIRRYLGDEDPVKIPLSYPLPNGPRKIPQGFDDPAE